MSNEAWCNRCRSSQSVDELGCVVCAAFREKHRPIRARYMTKRRARLKGANTCINGICHGPPEPGKTKCTRCLEVHRRSNRRAA